VRRFIAEQLELRNTTSNILAINAAPRGHLRWRGSCGDAVRHLLGVIASSPHWSLASLLLALTPAQIDRVLNSFMGAGVLRAPKRRYAIVRLALDLGMRGAESNRLQLDDIDWQRGTVTLKRTTSKREDAAIAGGHGQGTGVSTATEFSPVIQTSPPGWDPSSS
jgi:integrase